MLCESSRLRFEGLLSSCASGIVMAIFGWVASSLHAIVYRDQIMGQGEELCWFKKSSLEVQMGNNLDCLE